MNSTDAKLSLIVMTQNSPDGDGLTNENPKQRRNNERNSRTSHFWRSNHTKISTKANTVFNEAYNPHEHITPYSSTYQMGRILRFINNHGFSNIIEEAFHERIPQNCLNNSCPEKE